MLNNQKIQEIQNQTFGKRYENSTLSSVSQPPLIIKKLQSWIKKPEKMLVLCGSSGCGKTFLCSSILNYFLTKQMNVNPGREPFVYGYRESEFFRLVRTSGNEGYSRIIPRLLNNHMILFDDLGSSGVTEWRKEVIYDVINTRYESTLPTVITTNLSSNDIQNEYGYRISDRLFSKDNTIINMSELSSRRT